MTQSPSFARLGNPDDEKRIPCQPQTFATEWKGVALGGGLDGVPSWLVVCPPGQAEVVGHCCGPSLGVPLELGSPAFEQRIQDLEQSGVTFDCVVLLKSAWQQGVSDAGYVLFLQLLQRLPRSACRQLCVLAHAAIRCEPAYPRVRHPLDAAYLGLALAFGKETSLPRVRTYSLAHFDATHIEAALGTDPVNPNGGTLCIGNAKVWTATLVHAPLATVADTPYRPGGVYLIIGGGGGIGAVLARFLAQHYQATVVLIGRSAADEALMNEIRALGGIPVHQQLDIADDLALARALSELPSIDGIFHSALQLVDVPLDRMRPEQLMQSFRPKVHGSYQLLHALRERDQHPDFVVFFSSVQSYIAYPGQSNYVAACLFTDALSDLIEAMLSIRTKVVNWGYWGSVGVVADAVVREKMLRFQIGSIEPEQAMPLLEKMLASGFSQLACMRQSPRSLKLRHIEVDRQIDPTDHAPYEPITNHQ